MTTKNVPHIKSVTATKEGRFWAVKTDGKLLCIALYKQGALAVQELIKRLAGLAADEPENEKPQGKKSQAKPAAKKPSKGKSAPKAKPRQKAQATEKPSQTPAPVTAPATE